MDSGSSSDTRFSPSSTGDYVLNECDGENLFKTFLGTRSTAWGESKVMACTTEGSFPRWIKVIFLFFTCQGYFKALKLNKLRGRVLRIDFSCLDARKRTPWTPNSSSADFLTLFAVNNCGDGKCFLSWADILQGTTIQMVDESSHTLASHTKDCIEQAALQEAFRVRLQTLVKDIAQLICLHKEQNWNKEQVDAFVGVVAIECTSVQKQACLVNFLKDGIESLKERIYAEVQSELKGVVQKHEQGLQKQVEKEAKRLCDKILLYATNFEDTRTQYPHSNSSSLNMLFLSGAELSKTSPHAKFLRASSGDIIDRICACLKSIVSLHHHTMAKDLLRGFSEKIILALVDPAVMQKNLDEAVRFHGMELKERLIGEEQMKKLRELKNCEDLNPRLSELDGNIDQVTALLKIPQECKDRLKGSITSVLLNHSNELVNNRLTEFNEMTCYFEESFPKQFDACAEELLKILAKKNMREISGLLYYAEIMKFVLGEEGGSRRPTAWLTPYMAVHDESDATSDGQENQLDNFFKRVRVVLGNKDSSCTDISVVRDIIFRTLWFLCIERLLMAFSDEKCAVVVVEEVQKADYANYIFLHFARAFNKHLLEKYGAYNVVRNLFSPQPVPYLQQNMLSSYTCDEHEKVENILSEFFPVVENNGDQNGEKMASCRLVLRVPQYKVGYLFRQAIGCSLQQRCPPQAEEVVR